MTDTVNWIALCPVTLRLANDFVADHHRHNGRTSRNGGKFAMGARLNGDCLVGVAIVGNPLSASLMDCYTAEVLRLCVLTGAPKNTCSILYAACWQAWRAMGGLRLVTYTLQTESGTSLRGAGWTLVEKIDRTSVWNAPERNRHRGDKPIYHQKKQRWEISSPQKHKLIKDVDYSEITCARIEKAQRQTRMEFNFEESV